MPKLLTPAHTLLGDMYISVDYVNEYCESRNLPVAEHLQRLLAHGICHLTGYTHDADEDYELVRS